MNKLILAASAAAALAAPALVHAQALPPAVIAVVDVDRVYRDCNACKTATQQLQSQANAVRARQQALAGPLQTEGQQLQTAVNALGGKQPDAALAQRIRAFQTRQNQANQELSGREQTLQRNQAHVLQQINARLDPALQQVLTRRGANLMVDKGSVLKSANTVDVTNDVLAALNATLTNVSVTAPAQQQQQQQRAPSGR